MLIIDERDRYELECVLMSYGHDAVELNVESNGEIRINLFSFMAEDEVRNELARIGVPCRQI